MLAHNSNARPKQATLRAAQGATSALQSGLNFAPEVLYDSGASFVAVADINGDEKPDMVVTRPCTGASGCVDVLLGNGDGTFQTAVTYGSGGYAATSVAAIDVNGDGRIDLIVTNECASLVTNCGNTGPGP
jgi:hypothetical protein